MVKADRPWPRPQHVAWQSPYKNCTSTFLEPRLHGLPAYLNGSSCICPENFALAGSSVPAFSSLKTEQRDEVQVFCQYPGSEQLIKEPQDGRPMQNANSASMRKKLIIFDHSGDKTRLFYSSVFPLVQRPFVAATKFIQAYGVNEEKQEIDMGQNYLTTYSLPEESDDNDVNEGSEMHEDTEEINALLDSDDDYDNDDDFVDDDEVTSTDRSPLATKMAYVMQEQFEDTKEEVDSTARSNKRQKFVDGRGKRSSSVNSASSVRLNETFEYLSDAESKCSNSQMYSVEQARVGKDPMMDGIQFKKDKIQESLRILENMVPNAKGKEPLLVIDGTIEYLKSLMSQTGTLEVNYRQVLTAVKGHKEVDEVVSPYLLNS